MSFPGGTDVVRAIQSKMAFGQAATIPTIIAHEKAIKDIRLLSGSYPDPEVVFLVKKDSPLKSVEDLKGKKVGISEPGSNRTYFATKMLTDAGLKENQTRTRRSLDFRGWPVRCSDAAQEWRGR